MITGVVAIFHLSWPCFCSGLNGSEMYNSGRYKEGVYSDAIAAPECQFCGNLGQCMESTLVIYGLWISNILWTQQWLGLGSSNWVIPLPCIISFDLHQWNNPWDWAPTRLPSLGNSSRRLEEAAAVLRQLPRRGNVDDVAGCKLANYTLNRLESMGSEINELQNGMVLLRSFLHHCIT